jgi:hypothetical protein
VWSLAHFLIKGIKQALEIPSFINSNSLAN